MVRQSFSALTSATGFFGSNTATLAVSILAPVQEAIDSIYSILGDISTTDSTIPLTVADDLTTQVYDQIIEPTMENPQSNDIPYSNDLRLIEFENEQIRAASKLLGSIRKINRALNKLDGIEDMYIEVYEEKEYKKYWKESEAYDAKKDLLEERRRLRNGRSARLHALT